MTGACSWTGEPYLFGMTGSSTDPQWNLVCWSLSTVTVHKVPCYNERGKNTVRECHHVSWICRTPGVHKDKLYHAENSCRLRKIIACWCDKEIGLLVCFVIIVLSRPPAVQSLEFRSSCSALLMFYFFGGHRETIFHWESRIFIFWKMSGFLSVFINNAIKDRNIWFSNSAWFFKRPRNIVFVRD